MTYTVFNAGTNELLLMRVYDKRQSQLKTGRLEVKAPQEALRLLSKAKIRVKEVITDAHTRISKMLREEHPNIKHSHDIWHAAKNLGKKLHAEIFNGCVKHVVGQHEWEFGGRCLRPPEAESSQEYMKPRSKSHDAMKAIVMNPLFQKKFQYFVNTRTTYCVESFQNLILVYASKRFAYRFPAFRARCQLAALDYVQNMDRPVLYNRAGGIVPHRKCFQQSSTWTAYPVKKSKTYDHLPTLIKEVLCCKASDSLPTARKVVLMEEDPIAIAPTIAPVPPPPSRDLLAADQSRM